MGDLVTSILLTVGGGALLYGGGEALVRGAAALGLRLGLSPLFVGLTIVACGTSSPELVVSVEAAMEGRGDVAVGNVVGSNICNIALVLGICALIRPLRVESQLVRIDLPVAIVTGAGLLVILGDGVIARWEGGVLLAALLVYTAFSFVIARRESRKVQTELAAQAPRTHGSAVVQLALVAVGLGALVGGGILFVEGAVNLARALSVSEAVIGLTVVALGTSLPELSTSLVASFRGNGDVAIGNVVGSNIFNVLAILGVGAVVSPLHAPEIRIGDILVMVAFAAGAWPLLYSGLRLARLEGALLLGGYALYLFWRVG